MDIRKIALEGLMCFATVAPCKAQKTVQILSSTGITKSIDNKFSGFCGPEIQFYNKNNFTDIFVGGMVSQDKTASFVLRGVDNYSWAKHFSSWVRVAFMTSGKGKNLNIEAIPVRGKIAVNKLNFTLGPAYTLNNDLKNHKTTQGINTILQTSYLITRKDEIILETKYLSTPAKNLFHTSFGKIKDNTSMMLIYLKHFDLSPKKTHSRRHRTRHNTHQHKAEL